MAACLYSMKRCSPLLFRKNAIRYMKIVRKVQVLPSEWKGGKTYEYVIFPADSAYVNRNFDFRISSASIEQIPSDFTQFVGYQRYLIMLDGELNVLHNEKERVFECNTLFKFDSNDCVRSFSLGNDFNLMLKDGIDAQVEVVTDRELTADSAFVLIFALTDSEVNIGGEVMHLSTSDCVWTETKGMNFVAELSGKCVFARWRMASK